MGSPEERIPLIPQSHQDSEGVPGPSSAGTPSTVTYQTIQCDEDPRSRNQAPITYTWKNINVYGVTKNSHYWTSIFNRDKTDHSDKKHILKNVSGIAYPGELLVIMGSSGAGKTTLLNVLTYRCGGNTVVTGKVTVNGQKVNSSNLASRMAYVQQNDLFIGTLTVEEHLIFQALVRMDRDIPRAQRLKRVEEVINDLGLAKCRATIIGVAGRVKGISGGEMKRLAFASEVLTDPPLMLCDEPTSGLDSYMAHQVVSTIKTLTARGKTIIVTLHQPSSELYSMFDKIYLMAEGRVAFTGARDEAVAFFKKLGAPCPSNYNPADYFIQVLAIVPGRETSCRHTIEKICDDFQNGEYGKKMFRDIDRIHESPNDEFSPEGYKQLSHYATCGKYKATWWEQFTAVLWRSWVSAIKEPILIKVRILQTIMVSLLVGVIYIDQKLDQSGIMNINGALFIFLTNMTFQNVFAVINIFCTELPIFLRENRNGMYRTDIYFLCKTLAEWPIFILIPVIFTMIAYPLVGLYPSFSHFFIAAIIVALVANVATSFGYLISCLSKNISMALSIGPPVIIPFLLFGGFFLNTGSVPEYLKWLSHISWFRLGNEALLINQWSEVQTIDCEGKNSTCLKDGNTVLQTLSFDKSNFVWDIVGLVSLIIGFRVLALLALTIRTYRKPS